MGTHIVTVFSPINASPMDTATRLLVFFEREFTGYLENYFASIRYSSKKKSFEFFDETMGLKNQGDLMARLCREGAGMFACEIDLGFAPSVANVAVFDGPTGTHGTTVLITFEKELTSYLFTSEVTTEPFALVLESIARALGADCFVAGADYNRWLPLPPAALTTPEVFGPSPQVVGWRHGAVDSARVLNALGARPEWLLKTLHGFEMVTLIGRHQQRTIPQVDTDHA